MVSLMSGPESLWLYASRDNVFCYSFFVSWGEERKKKKKKKENKSIFSKINESMYYLLITAGEGWRGFNEIEIKRMK